MATIDRRFRQFRRSGNADALASVFDATAPGLLRVATTLVHDPNVAEDLVQSTFLIAIERRDSWREEASVRHWLVGILTRLARDRRRRDGRRPDAARLQIAKPVEPPRQAEARELNHTVQERIAHLPDVYRPVLTAHLEQGLAAHEIAHALDRPPGTVRTQLVRGLELLRRCLPAGLAGSLVVSTASPHGLGAIRAEVLRAARLAFPAGGSLAASAARPIRLGSVAFVTAIVAVVTALGFASRALFFADPKPSMPDQQPVAVGATDGSETRGAASGASTLERTVAEAAWQRGELTIDVVREGTSQPAPAVAVSALLLDGRDELTSAIWHTTDAAGRVALAVTPGHYRIAVDVGETVDVELRPGQRRAVALGVEPGFEVLGQVVDAAGAPVADAQIWVHRGHRDQDGAPAHGHPVAVSDAAGRFRVEHMHEWRWIDARKTGAAPSRAYMLCPPSDSPSESPPRLTLELGGPAATLRGRILAAGKPVAGALLELIWSDPERTRVFQRSPVLFWQQRMERTSRPDTNGRFEFADLPAGAATLVVRRAHHVARKVEVELVAGATAVRDVAIVPGNILRGTVRDPDGVPLADAVVSTSIGGFDYRAHSTAAGTFEFTALPTATLAILVSRDGFCGARLERAVGAGAVETCAIVLEPLRRLRGRVVGRSGEGVAGCNVVANRTGALFVEVDADGRVDEWARRGRHATTGPDGGFEVAVVPEEEYALTVQPPFQQNVIEDATWAGLVAPREGIELCLRPEHLPTAYVELQPLTDTGTPLTDVTFRLVAPLPTQSLAGGRVRLGPLAPGRYSVLVERTSAPDLRFPLPPIELRPHEVVDLGECRAPAPGELAHFVVHARYADGQPPRTAYVTLSPVAQNAADASKVAPSTTLGLDEAGRAELCCEPGRYNLWIGGGGFCKQRLVVDLARGERRQCDLVLAPAVSRVLVCPLPAGETRGEIRVLGPRGDEVAVDFPTLLPDTGPRVFRFREERPSNCSWSLWLTPGRHRVALECASGRRWTSEFTVTDLSPNPAPITLVWSPIR